ncbi:MAG: alginate lyase family protein [Chloroflexi bacterium]|nr:alginate lyase family protein [Chloroflexota bacterium]
MPSITHYADRLRELGIRGAVEKVGGRATKAGKLWGESLYWQWKANQEMSDADLLNQIKGDWQTIGAVLTQFATRSDASFLLPHESRIETVTILRERYPEYVAATLALADAACRNEFTLFGQVVKYPDEINWHRDPVTGYEWPALYIARLEQLLWSAERTADLKPIWELNRHQHFIALGMAYWLTDDIRYYEAFAKQTESWIKANPVLHGINWFSSLELGIRLIAWSVAFQFFRKVADFREKLGPTFLKSLYQQANVLSTHLTHWEAVPNNHLIGEAAGLAITAALFPEFKESAQWLEIGLRHMNEQMVAQTHPDGANKEQGTGYHQFVAEFVQPLVLLAKRGLIAPQPTLEDTLYRMVDYIQYSKTPDGTMQNWGDQDDGRAVGLNLAKPFWDFRQILAFGAAYYQRPDWKFSAGRFDEESFWLLGKAGLEAWEKLSAQPPAEISKAYPDAGHYILRDDWSATSDTLYFRCGPYGLGGEGESAHAHCDMLSPILWIGGRAVLVDAGTYLYFGPARDQFRTTASHNTLMIDGKEQAIPRTDFSWEQVPQGECMLWEPGKRVVGAMQTRAGVRHERAIHHPAVGIWEITDTLHGDSTTHDVKWFYHFAPDLTLQQSDGRVWAKNVREDFTIEVIVPAEVQLTIEAGEYSSNYGRRQSNQVIIATWQGAISEIRFVWKFSKMEQK